MVTLNNYIKHNTCNIKCMSTKIKGVSFQNAQLSRGGGAIHDIVPIRRKGRVVGSIVLKTFSNRGRETPTHGCSHTQQDWNLVESV